MSDTVEARRLTMAQRFRALVTPEPKKIDHEAIAEALSQVEKLSAELQNWTTDAPSEFWQALASWLKEAHISVRGQLNDTHATAYNIGFEAGVEMVAEKFNQWKGSTEPGKD